MSKSNKRRQGNLPCYPPGNTITVTKLNSQPSLRWLDPRAWYRKKIKVLTGFVIKKAKFKNKAFKSNVQERMGLMAYFMSLRQMGHWERARAHDEQVTMCAQGRKTMSISASMHTLHMWESLIFSSSAASSWEVWGFPEVAGLSLSEG